jgi:hypothetical protein
MANAFGKSQKSRLHIGRKGPNFCAHRLIQDFYLPKHNSVYLKIEITATEQP